MLLIKTFLVRLCIQNFSLFLFAVLMGAVAFFLLSASLIRSSLETKEDDVEPSSSKPPPTSAPK